MHQIDVPIKAQKKKGLAGRVIKRTFTDLPMNIKNINMGKYVASVVGNFYLLHLIDKRIFIITIKWQIIGALIGYFIEIAACRELFPAMFVKREVIENENKKPSLITNIWNKFNKKDVATFEDSNKPEVVIEIDPVIEVMTKILNEFKFEPKYISKRSDDFANRYEFKLKALQKSILTARADIEAQCEFKKDSLTISFNRSKTVFVVEKEDRKVFELDPVLAEIDKEKLSIEKIPFLIGISKTDCKYKIRYMVDDYHALIIGGTGSGKSTTLHSIIRSIMYLNQNVVFYATDFKEAAVIKYKDFDNVIWYEPTYEDMLKMFNDIKKEFNRRKALLRSNKLESFIEYNKLEGVEKLPYIVILTDEANGYKTFKSKQAEELEDIRFELIRVVRSTGMGFMETVQRNVDEKYSKSIRTQMDLKIIHNVDRSDIGNCCGDEEQKEIIRTLEKGDFVMNYNDSVYDSFRSPFAKESDGILKMLKEAYEGEK